MKLKALFGVLLLTLSACVTIQPVRDANDIPPDVTHWAQNNVMSVFTLHQGFGSGFWVDNETFVTACHVVGSEEYVKTGDAPNDWEVQWVVQDEVLVATWDLSISLDLAVKSCNQTTDIAILKRQWYPSDSDYTALTAVYAHPNPEQGSTVYGAGFGLMEKLYISVGHWQHKALYPDHDRNYMITAPTVPGDSGSPALDYKNGVVRVVGIRQSGRLYRSGYSPPVFIPHLIKVSDAMSIHAEVEKFRVGEN